jgi:peptidyl-prolyl cis-trans isomerase SurA
MLESKHPGDEVMRNLFLFFRSSLLVLILLASVPLFASIVVEEIVARVGNEIITKTEYETEQQRLYDQLSKHFQGDELQKQYAEQSSQLLDFMINQKLLEQRARELDLNVEEEIKAAVQKLRDENNIPDDNALDTALKQEGSSLAQLREDFRRRIIQQRILWNYVQGKVNITEDEIKNFYEQHKSEMVTPPVMKIKRYTITGENVEKGILNAEARSLWTALTQKIAITPENFPHMTLGESTEISSSELDPKVSKILEDTSPGSYTDLIEVPSGYAIFLMEDRKEAKPVPFEEARGQIYNNILQERAEKYQKSFMEDLRKQSFVVVNRTPKP